MYWCEEHGAVENPKIAYDSTGMYEVCPECKSELTAADRCICGNWIDPTEYICEDCKKFISNIGLLLTDEFAKQTGREITEEKLRELIERWLES